MATIHPDDLLAFRKAVDSLKECDTMEVEYRQKTKSGEYRWYSNRMSLTYDGAGNPLYRNGNIRDITQRMKAEIKILQQNTILDSINRVYESTLKCETTEELGQACLDIIETATGSKFSFINEVDPDGMSHDIAISDPGWELCSMHDQTGHRRLAGNFKPHGLYGSVIKNGTSLLTNDPSHHPDSIGVPHGHPTLTAFLGVPFIRDSKVLGLIGVGNREGGYRIEDQQFIEAIAPTILEVLYEKRAEEAFRKSGEQYRILFESMHQGVICQDSEGVVISMNPIAERILGKTQTEFSDSFASINEHITLCEDGSPFPGF